MNKLVVVALLVVGGLAGAHAMAPVDLSGTWTMGLHGHDHVIPIAFVLKHEGAKVTGTLTLPEGMPNSGDLPLAGEFSGDSLKLATTDEYTGPMKMKITGKLLEDGTLAGDIVVGGHDQKMDFTAERLKKRAKKSEQ